MPKVPKATNAAPPTHVPTRGHQWYNEDPYPGKEHKGKGKGKKGKRPTNVIPQVLQGQNNVAVDGHGRRLCFNSSNLNKCRDAAHGAQCSKRMDRLVEKGVWLEECMIIEVFCGTARVTACLKQYGLSSCFGVDYLHSKQAASQVIIADLCTSEGTALVRQWLSHEFVVGIFLAPLCGSASRAREISLGKGCKHVGPRLLRDDEHPNGRPNLTLQERRRVSLANRLYHLTAELGLWAIRVGCIFCVENPQYSLFWATTFWTAVADKFQYTIFHFRQYGSARKKKTMLAHNGPAFHAICAKCPGQNAKHKHAAWGVNSATKRFATSEETASPMGLAKMIANCFVVALQSKGVQMPPQSIHEVDHLSLDYLRKLRATSGLQPRASRIPPLVRPFKAKTRLHTTSLTAVFKLYQKLPRALSTELPKGSKLLSVEPLPSTSIGRDEVPVADADSSVTDGHRDESLFCMTTDPFKRGVSACAMAKPRLPTLLGERVAL